MTTGFRWDQTQSSFSYLRVNQSLGDYTSAYNVSLLSIVNTLLVAAILSPTSTKNSTIDLWRNVKIPTIERYEETAAQAPDEEGWYQIEDDNHEYSSLVGIPMVCLDFGPESGGNNSSIRYHFNMENEYFSVECSVLDTNSSIPPLVANPNGYITGLFTGVRGWLGNAAAMWSSGANSSSQRYQEEQDGMKPFPFQYAILGLTGSSCSIAMTYVESQVTCDSGLCSVSKIRRSQSPHPPAGFTLFDELGPDDVSDTWTAFAKGFVSSIDSSTDTPTAVQGYLLEPGDPLKARPDRLSGDSSGFDQIVSLPLEIYSSRLGQLMNSYWACLQGRLVISSGMSNTTASLNGSGSYDPFSISTIANTSTVTGTMSINTSVIECHIGWVTALLIASAVMSIAVVVNVVLRVFFINSPDVMLNVSSLATRHNQYIATPQLGTYADAADRARSLKRHKIRFGDVEPECDSGTLAIASLDHPKEYIVTGVRKRRLYR